MMDKITKQLRAQTETVVASQKLWTEWMLAQQDLATRQVEASIAASKSSFETSRKVAEGLQKVWAEALTPPEAAAS